MGADAGAFPAWSEADWRKAAEAALKGANLDTLASSTADGVRIEPLYPPGEGPRPLQADGPWRVIARLDHPDAGEANAQALDDFAGGADGLQVVFAGARSAPMDLASHGPMPATLHAAFDGVRFDQGLTLRTGSRPRRPPITRGISRRSSNGRARVPPTATCRFGLDPLRRPWPSGPLPADWDAHVDALHRRGACAEGERFRRAARRRRRAIDPRGGRRAGQELAFALGAAVALLRALSAAGLPLDEARQRIAFRLAADADEFVTLSKFRALAADVGAGRGGVRPQRPGRDCPGRERVAHDDGARPLRECDARGDGGVFSRPRRGRQRQRPAAYARRSAFPTVSRGVLRATASSFSCANPISALSQTRPPGAGAFEALTRVLCDNGLGPVPGDRERGRPGRDAGARRVPASGRRERVSAEARCRAAQSADHRRQRASLISPRLASSSRPARRSANATRLAKARLRRCGSPNRSKPCAPNPTPFSKRRASGRKRLLVALGPEPSHRRRVAFMREWLEAGGIEPVYEGEAETPRCGDQAAEDERRTSCVSLRRRRGLRRTGRKPSPPRSRPAGVRA